MCNGCGIEGGGIWEEEEAHGGPASIVRILEQRAEPAKGKASDPPSLLHPSKAAGCD